MSDVITRREVVQTHVTCAAPHLTKYHLLAVGRFFSANGQACAVVASVFFSPRGKLVDWVAYWGGGEQGMSRENVAQIVAANGMKMSQGDGVHFFPRLEPTCYR